MNAHRPSALVLALAALAFAGAASAAPASQEDWFGAEPAVQGKPLSRAEVAADLALWDRAGLRGVGEGDRSALADPANEQRLAEYHRLRSGPEYLAEVRRQGGEDRSVAGQATAAGGN
ncbi:DUF4148 domain-containing protein [Paracidovorax cattleyae]|uniref:DUF4148 domain-containing protein n=1 Tax=Paracidovorax cattleyae TaxID=80868 RepID=A0A1H0PBN1_9BURK|nr:DUF4148 domain-containing protein [Paracidovorax cattleyae]AVS76052.1 DUF4148 domain-containing protein [Paracidovorax cattleyae]MBF9264905.1 DUF4148 domain-containing protein [Paracidovorax cattleyae]SDP02170.1 protein of unknown function [Paracidovorax cattleyae]